MVYGQIRLPGRPLWQQIRWLAFAAQTSILRVWCGEMGNSWDFKGQSDTIFVSWMQKSSDIHEGYIASDLFGDLCMAIFHKDSWSVTSEWHGVPLPFEHKPTWMNMGSLKPFYMISSGWDSDLEIFDSPHCHVGFLFFLLSSASSRRLHNTINNITPSTQDHLHNTIYTTPSTLHHQHNTINTTPSTHHHQQHTIHNTPSTQHHQHNTINTTPSTQHHQHNTINTTHHQHNTINTTSSTQHHQHNTINTTPSTQHHQHNNINTTTSTQHHPHITINLSPSTTHHQRTPSTQHHQHNTIHTTPSTHHHPQHHQHNNINTTPSTYHHQPTTINSSSTQTQHHQHNTLNTTPSTQHQHLRLLLRGRGSTQHTAPASPAPFAWQVQHLEHLRLGLRGRRSTWSTSGSFCLAGGTWSTSASFCLAGAALGASSYRGQRKSGDEWCEWAPPRCAWQAQHSEHIRFLLRGRRSTWSTSGSFLRGRCSTWSTFIEVGGSLATSDASGRRLVLRGRCNTCSTSGSFCVACAALGAPQARFAWQAQHLEHLRFVLPGRRSTWSIFL